MKRNVLRLSALVCVLLLTFDANAQKLHVGATTGINTTIILDKGLLDDPRYNSTYTYSFSPIGLAVGFDFGPRFGLQLESILTNQTQIFEVIDIAKTVVGERRIDLQSINIPLLFKFMNGSGNRARMNFSLGPQLAILTEGRETLLRRFRPVWPFRRVQWKMEAAPTMFQPCLKLNYSALWPIMSWKSSKKLRCSWQGTLGLTLI